MGKFKIDFNTGVEREVEGTLEDAKSEAYKGMALTCEDITIYDEDNNEVTRSRWEGIEVGEEDYSNGLVLTTFGSYGFYVRWSDELVAL